MGARYVTPRPRRVYAHILRGDFCCPRCGRLHVSGGSSEGSAGRGRYAHAKPGGSHPLTGYDALTGHFRCTDRTCGYTAYLGVVFWPTNHARVGLQQDHVLNPAEAAELRLELSYGEEAPPVPRLRSGQPAKWGRYLRTNVECTCEEPCPVHGGRRGKDDV